MKTGSGICIQIRCKTVWIHNTVNTAGNDEGKEQDAGKDKGGEGKDNGKDKGGEGKDNGKDQGGGGKETGKDNGGQEQDTGKDKGKGRGEYFSFPGGGGKNMRYLNKKYKDF